MSRNKPGLQTEGKVGQLGISAGDAARGGSVVSHLDTRPEQRHTAMAKVSELRATVLSQKKHLEQN